MFGVDGYIAPLIAIAVGEHQIVGPVVPHLEFIVLSDLLNCQFIGLADIQVLTKYVRVKGSVENRLRFVTDLSPRAYHMLDAGKGE